MMPKKLAAMLTLEEAGWWLMRRSNLAPKLRTPAACQEETPLSQGPEQGTQVFGLFPWNPLAADIMAALAQTLCIL